MATAGVILVGDVDLLAEDVDPTTLVGEQAEADGVMVQAVDVDEGATVSFTGSVEEVDQALLSELQLVDDAEVATGDVYIQVEELSLSN